MQNNRRQFYVYDFEVDARKNGATIPSMASIVPIFESMKAAGKSHSIRGNTATLLIGDIADDATKSFVTLLVRLSDTLTPNSVYSEPSTGQFQVHLKQGKVGADFGCHVLISTKQEKNRPNIYTCVIEKVPGISADLVRRLLSKILNFQFKEDPTSFRYPAPGGGLDSNNQPKMERCCPHIELRGRPSDSLINDINNGKLSGVSLVKTETATPIGGAAFLKKSSSELRLQIDHLKIPSQLWNSLKSAFQQNASTYAEAKVSYKVPNSSRTVTVSIDASTGTPLTELYVESFELTNIFPFLDHSSQSIVQHLTALAVPKFLSSRDI